MTLAEFRAQAHPEKTRHEFVAWLDKAMREHRYSLRFTRGMLSTYDAGTRAPPLPTVIAITEITNGLVGIHDWPYLKRRFPGTGKGLIELTYK